MTSVKHDFSGTFFSKLCEFRISGEFSDVIIECGTKSFRCHRAVLAAGCEYFDVMFRTGFKESATQNIVLRDIDATTFDMVLQFLYSGQVVIDQDNVLSILQIGDYFGIEGLEELCVLFLNKNLRSVNVLELYLFACTTQNAVLMDMLSRCDMTEQLAEYFKSDAHLVLPFDIFTLIVKQWRASSQDAIVRWTNSSIATRRQHFDDLVQTHAEVTIPDFGSSLYVYVNYKPRYEDTFVKTYAINHLHSTTCSPLPVSNASEYLEERLVIRDGSRMFIHSEPREDPKFFISESIDMSPTRSLKPPPMKGSDVILCHMPNHGLYMYDRGWPSAKPNPQPNHDIENIVACKIHRGIVFYDYGVDDWFCVPPRRKRTERSCMTVVDDMLYLIGGATTSGYAQAYDHRAGVWLKMPKTECRYTNPCCTTMNGTIYVCGTGGGEKFNAVAGKWEQIQSLPTYISDFDVKLVPFADNLWMFQSRQLNHLHIDVYDPVLDSWRVVTETLGDTGRDRDINLDVSASFVFKSL